MRLKVPAEHLAALRSALIRAGKREIGGQLFGEQFAPSHFGLLELTFQKRPGTFARFIVDLTQAARDAVRFFNRTNRNYSRFNYIGEWHSHPSFAVEPSDTDIETMLDLVGHTSFGGTFAILMIVRLDVKAEVISKAWLFDPVGQVVEVNLETGT